MDEDHQRHDDQRRRDRGEQEDAVDVDVRVEARARLATPGSGERSPGADVGGVSPVPAQMWAGVSAVLVQMWQQRSSPGMAKLEVQCDQRELGIEKLDEGRQRVDAHPARANPHTNG